ncbi:MAG: hypothetical protein IKW76_13960, partial [Clostridia bacterium]|nr:hypothetical protein [Clostridia bacterium]
LHGGCPPDPKSGASANSAISANQTYLLFIRAAPVFLCRGGLRCPKSQSGSMRRAILTAAPLPPRCIRRRRRFGGDAANSAISAKRMK